MNEMPLKRIGALWKPKPGGKAALSGVLSLLGGARPPEREGEDL